MPAALAFGLFFALGICNGLRTMTPVAVLCWGAHLGWIGFAHTPFAFLGNPVSLWVFTVLALGELVADKLPKTPARTQAPGLIGRCVFGTGAGAALAAAAGASLVLGGVAGLLGALVGTYGGYGVRRALTGGRLPDLPVALVEDLLAVGGSFFLVSRF